MSARMHWFLNHMARDHRNSNTLDILSSMRDELSEISATRDSFEEVVIESDTTQYENPRRLYSLLDISVKNVNLKIKIKVNYKSSH